MATHDPQKLAEKIAKLLQAESQSLDLASLYASIEKINHRLDKLERSESPSQSAITLSQTSHPSQDRFAIAEAIVDGLFDRDSKEKACTFEPSKPCDHCSMCNSRGF